MFQETDGGLATQKGLPDLWATLEFDTPGNQRLSIGRRYIEREYGTASVLFLAKSGKGPEEVLIVAQQFANAAKELYQEEVYETLTGLTGTAHLENVSPPNAEPYEDGNWLVCSVACVYTYDCVRGTP
jgi:hypothetical protein